MRTLHKIAFLLEEFAQPSPAQQLLDRFLIGYPRDGAFQRVEGREITAFVSGGGSQDELQRRSRDFRLKIAPTAQAAVEGTVAIVIVPREPGAVANEDFLQLAIQRAASGATCFVHGRLSNSLGAARSAASSAKKRKVILAAGTPLSVTWRLPEVDLPKGTAASEALIVVQGAFPVAELHALDGLLPVIERRKGGEKGVRRVRFIEGDDVWRAGDEKAWSWDLLASALSHSHTPQAESVVDGRTQDLVGLGLVPKLAKAPRAWLIEHKDGLRTTLLVLDGVVKDINFAVRVANETITSAQLFRAPSPAEHHFSRLAATIEEFFVTGKAPWRIERSLLTAQLLETFQSPSARIGEWVKMPG